MTDAPLTLDEVRKLKGGQHVTVQWSDGWKDRPERYRCTWRGGLLWAVNQYEVQERVICWSAGAKPTETLTHKVWRA